MRLTIAAITIYPFIFYNTRHKSFKEDFDVLQRHEMVHINQVNREIEKYSIFGWPKFYLSYLYINVIKGVKYGEGKYEKEAFHKEDGHKHSEDE